MQLIYLKVKVVGLGAVGYCYPVFVSPDFPRNTYNDLIRKSKDTKVLFNL